MRTDHKLAHLRGALSKLHLSDVVVTARRALEERTRSSRPLRGMDGWSDQTEVAFYEEHGARRA